MEKVDSLGPEALKMFKLVDKKTFTISCPYFLFIYRSMICLFGLWFYAPVNSYGHVETVSSPNHTFSCASLT